MRWIVRTLVPVALSAMLAAPLLARDANKVLSPADLQALINGKARVIDGDTIDVAGTRLRLEGIDAPETGQTCTAREGWLRRVALPSASTPTWECGGSATRALIKLIGGNEVACRPTGTDKYERTLAICHVGGLDINGEMVRQGHAWAFVKYSQRYASVEAEARTARRGIWQAPTMPAWEHRAQSWQTAEPKAPGGCAIKGNITNHGRIYHLPWSPWYGKTKIDESRGERWFCSESEAVAAGWRSASTH